MAERAPRRRRGDTRVFVYGSLLRGEPNHRLLRGARFIGVDRTRAAFTLFDLGGFPAMATDGTVAVIGEIYEVDAAMLVALDRLEGHPRFYMRTPIRLQSRRHAEVYVIPRARLVRQPVIVGGDWKAHLQARLACADAPRDPPAR